MRWILLAALCAALVGCRTRIQPERESEIYGGIGVQGLPGIGGTVVGGQYFSKHKEMSDFAFELRGGFQGGVDDSPTQSGKFAQIQAGVRQNLSPGHDQRLYFRYGVTWFRAVGDPNIVDEPGDYFGAYGAVGYEWRLGRRFWIGPEITVNGVNGEGPIDWEVLPQIGFNLLFDF